MADKSLYIPNDVKQNYPFCRLKFVIKKTYGSEINNSAKNYSIRVSEVVKPTNKKTLL